MDDVNAILNGEIFILREEMNSIANFERNVKTVERNAKRENGLYKTFRMLSSTIVIIQLRSMALCMYYVFFVQKERPMSCRELYN